ncbi:hypothetical protein [Methylobacterium sp. Leaf112]|uniref:hypothetical protein n=1 Tax=Methylobacterium sp. Leaf112 TaxID=1736258 RepID=UPI0006F87AB1|nr:hypothetical protein [Methylobacterium sp. Leaf112]KQP62170.1 hypothetical protein ASF52_05795 [Methylobacterium sp. Leaf112]
MSVSKLRDLRDDIEGRVTDGVVEPSLGRGVFAYASALLRLAEDGDRDPALALREARSAAAFLASVSLLPPAHPRTWSPS